MGGYGWGEVQEKELIDAVHTALDKGINFFDTADTYGLGQSEITLAKGLGNQRKNVVVQSKFGVRFSPEGTVYDNTPEYIRSALEKLCYVSTLIILISILFIIVITRHL